MKIIYINKKHHCRKTRLDEAQNRLWVAPSFREKFIEKRRVGFNLDQLEELKEMPDIAGKVSQKLPLVYLIMMFKDNRQVAVGVDEKGLYALTAALKTAEQRNEGSSDSLIFQPL